VSDLGELQAAMRTFTVDRDWERFHDPKSLALALVGEVGELAALLQWLPAEDAVRLAASEPLSSRLGEELADVLLYLVRLADVVGVDLVEAAREKLSAAVARYPSAEYRGQAPAAK
jgi:dCTP diphosphatase